MNISLLQRLAYSCRNGLVCRGLRLKNLGTVSSARLMSSSSHLPPYGSGVSKGHGTGGTIRDGGGAFADRELAIEEIYFRNLTSEQLHDLHNHHLEEIRHLEKELKETEASLKEHRTRLDALKKLVNEIKKD